MAKGNTFQSDWMKLVFNAVAIANMADNAASSPLTNLYVSLHAADPTAAGNQTSSEANYTGYLRVAVVRTSAGWTISGSSPTQAANAAAVIFPQCTGGSSTVTFFAVGTVASAGTGKILYSGALSSPVTSLAVTNGITPSFAIGALVFTEN